MAPTQSETRIHLALGPVKFSYHKTKTSTKETGSRRSPSPGCSPTYYSPQTQVQALPLPSTQGNYLGYSYHSPGYTVPQQIANPREVPQITYPDAINYQPSFANQHDSTPRSFVPGYYPTPLEHLPVSQVQPRGSSRDSASSRIRSWVSEINQGGASATGSVHSHSRSACSTLDGRDGRGDRGRMRDRERSQRGSSYVPSDHSYNDAGPQTYRTSQREAPNPQAHRTFHRSSSQVSLRLESTTAHMGEEGYVYGTNGQGVLRSNSSVSHRSRR